MHTPILKSTWTLLATCLACVAALAQVHPTMKVRELPEALKQQWLQTNMLRGLILLVILGIKLPLLLA